jgi:hypothetical protein
MKKRLIVYGVLGLGLAVYAAFYGYGYFSDGATLENFEKLELGMTKGEVRGVLGWGHSYWGYVIVKGQVHVNVEGRTGTAMLAFDEQDRLIWKGWDEGRRRRTLREEWEHLPETIGIVKIRE